MPVFSVTEYPKTVSAELRADGTVHKHKVTGRDATWSRVGTAYARSDGGFTIRLTAIPLNGTLVMRPPLPDEHPEHHISSAITEKS
jgi:hypothetical protein